MKDDIHKIFLAGPRIYRFDKPRIARIIRRQIYIERARLSRVVSHPTVEATEYDQTVYNAARGLVFCIVGWNLCVEKQTPGYIARQIAQAVMDNSL